MSGDLEISKDSWIRTNFVTIAAITAAIVAAALWCQDMRTSVKLMTDQFQGLREDLRGMSIELKDINLRQLKDFEKRISKSEFLIDELYKKIK